MNRFFAAIAVLIFFFKAAHSQTYSYLNYTQRNVLPSSNIYTLYQDKDGFIWAGTDNGFVRFDGSDFKLFSENNSIAESETFAIFQDSRNRLWMYNYSNCLCYYLNGELFSCDTDSTLKGDFRFFIIKKIFEDKDGVVWFAGHGLVSYSSNSTVRM